MSDNNDQLQIVPRLDTMLTLAADIARQGRADAQLAPIWAEKLRHTYKQVLETKYPELAAANGDVLPIDTSVDPAAESWEYFMIDHAGFASWIDDDGHLAPNGALTMTRYTGYTAEMGFEYNMSIFDLERAAKASLPISNLYLKNAKRYHDAKKNWVWLFGDSAKQLPGLCNHPNITKTLAPLNDAGTSRAWADKSVDEIAADLALLIDSVAENTLRAHFVATVFMPLSMMQVLRNKRLGAGDGTQTLYDWMKARYSGDDTGQGAVKFVVLNECASTLRRNPETGSDTSGIPGDFLLAIPSASKDELAFIQARPFTQRPPQETGFKMHHMTHSKVGGCKCSIPLAVHRMDFAVGS